MPRTFLFAFILSIFTTVSLSLGQPNPHVASTEPRSPDEERATFRLPPGFQISLVASEPQINKPMNLNFDDRGRLWVTSSVEYPFPVPPDKAGRDSVKIIELDENGKAAKVTTFADGLNIPIGVLPLPTPPPLLKKEDNSSPPPNKDNTFPPPLEKDKAFPPPLEKGGSGGVTSAIVFSIPNLLRLTDTNGDAVADQREILFGPFGQRDTHGLVNGLTLGFDGWVYACHGFANDSTIKGKDGHEIKMNSGNVFRFKPDGSRVQQYTWGQVNPFGLAFTPWGDLFSVDCHSRPVMMLLRGGYYQSFGKPHDGLGFAPEICNHDHGSTGLAGIAYYAADQFPPEYRDNTFIGNVITNRINRDRFEKRGSTLVAIAQPDFLTSDDPWFRPVDVKLGPDGALYVADFYNRIIGHYEVPLTHPGRDRERGRIWRISYVGDKRDAAARYAAKDLARAEDHAVYAELGGTNWHLAMQALHQLAVRNPQQVLDFIRRPRSTDAAWSERATPRLAWLQERLGARPNVAASFPHGDRNARVLLLRLLAERPDWTDSERQLVLDALAADEGLVQRFAADALGRHPSPSNLRPLLDLCSRVPRSDTQLVHAARMALRNQLNGQPAWEEANALATNRQSAAVLADVSLGVPTAEAAHFIARNLAHLDVPLDAAIAMVRHVARYGSSENVLLVLHHCRDARADLGQQFQLFKAMHQGTQERGAASSAEADQWYNDLAGKLLASSDRSHVQAGAELATLLRLEAFLPRLLELATARGMDEAQRVAACSALATIQPKKHCEVLGKILTDGSEPIGLQEQVAEALTRANTPETRTELLKALPTAPARLQTGIAMRLAGSREGAEGLLAAVADGKASARLLQERAVVVRLEQTRVRNLNERLAALTRGLPPADQKLLEVMNHRRGGYQAAKRDGALGGKLFEKHCALCHQIANQGARIGPQLDGIGIRGLDRLLEDLLDPNRNVDQSFRATSLLLKSGQVLNGLVLREEGAVIVLADAQGKEVRVPTADVEERKLQQTSPMPPNVLDLMTEEEFYHLLAFLLEQKPK